jgi:two-component system, OmpR family, sensor histidine kinase KdpD
MHLDRYSREVARWITASFAAMLTTVVLVRIGVNATTAGMIFLVLVVWTATQAGIQLSLFIAVLCALFFDYFFLPPYHTFVLAGGPEWVAMLSFVASSLVAGRVAEQARRQAHQAEQRREDVERLYTLSQEMMLHEGATGLVRNLPQLLERIFSLDGVALFVRDLDQSYTSTTNLPTGLEPHLRDLASGQEPSSSLPEGFSAQGLLLGLRSVGGLAWRPDRLSREVATAISAQVAIAMTRAIAIEANTRMEASRESERLRVALIDSLTHELRTPLTSIRAAATTLMESEGLDEATRLDLASVVDEEASRLDLLIGEAVEMAEIDANVVQVNLTQEPTRALLERAIEDSRMLLAHHEVVLDAAEPDKPVWFDPHLLSRVFRHLLENASRYCPRGSRITLSSRRQAGRLEFAVEDNGPGIDPMDLPMIFEKFYRGKKAGTRGKGSGMGLAIARAILKAHGGGVEAVSVPGTGTTFRFWVPLVENQSDVEQKGHPNK